MMQDLMKLSNGNPGALTMLMGIVTAKDPNILVEGTVIISTLEKYKIYGTHAYVLWSDLANKNYSLMAYLCENVPKDILIDASHRQDYSGRELVKEYVDNYNVVAAIAAEEADETV